MSLYGSTLCRYGTQQEADRLFFGELDHTFVALHKRVPVHNIDAPALTQSPVTKERFGDHTGQCWQPRDQESE